MGAANTLVTAALLGAGVAGGAAIATSAGGSEEESEDGGAAGNLGARISRAVQNAVQPAIAQIRQEAPDPSIGVGVQPSGGGAAKKTRRAKQNLKETAAEKNLLQKGLDNTKEALEKAKGSIADVAKGDTSPIEAAKSTQEKIKETAEKTKRAAEGGVLDKVIEQDIPLPRDKEDVNILQKTKEAEERAEEREERRKERREEQREERGFFDRVQDGAEILGDKAQDQINQNEDVIEKTKGFANAGAAAVADFTEDAARTVEDTVQDGIEALNPFD